MSPTGVDTRDPRDARDLRVPAGLEFDPESDPQRGRHLVLVAPWGSTVASGHDQAGWELRRGDVEVDRALLASGLSVNVDHDPGLKVGSIVDAVVDREGLWAVIDLDDDGKRCLARGRGDVSAELIQPKDRDWLLAGLALVPLGGRPAIPGSRVVFGESHRTGWVDSPGGVFSSTGSWLASVAREADVAGGVVQINRGGIRAPDPPVVRRPPADITRHKAWQYGMSMSAVEDQVARDRRTFWQKRAQARQQAQESHRDWLQSHGIWPSDARHPDHADWCRKWDQMQANREAARERARVAAEAAEAAAADTRSREQRIAAEAAAQAREEERQKRWTVRLAKTCRSALGIPAPSR